MHSVINNLLQERPGIGFAMALVNTSALQEIHLSVRYVILKCALHLKNVEKIKVNGVMVANPDLARCDLGWVIRSLVPTIMD